MAIGGIAIRGYGVASMLVASPIWAFDRPVSAAETVATRNRSSCAAERYNRTKLAMSHGSEALCFLGSPADPWKMSSFGRPTEPRREHAAGARAHIASHVAETIEELRAIEARDRATMSAPNRIAALVSRRSGSLLFAVIHVIWFSAWLAMNIPDWPLRFDPFPFGLLTTIVSLEAILLSVFILMSENRQVERDERQAKVDLEVNLVAEREVTKVISLLTAIHHHLGIPLDDEEVEQMHEPTRVGELVEAVEGLTPPDQDADSADAPFAAQPPGHFAEQERRPMRS